MDFANSTTIKLVVLGASGVGKTSLRGHYIHSRFSPGYRATIGADFISKTLSYPPDDPHEKIVLQIWDTAGQERFSSLSRAFFRGADAVLLVFDVNAPETLLALKKWWNDFREGVPIAEADERDFCVVLVGNKVDPMDNSTSAITIDDALDFCGRLIPPPTRVISRRSSLPPGSLAAPLLRATLLSSSLSTSRSHSSDDSASWSDSTGATTPTTDAERFWWEDTPATRITAPFLGWWKSNVRSGSKSQVVVPSARKGEGKMPPVPERLEELVEDGTEGLRPPPSSSIPPQALSEPHHATMSSISSSSSTIYHTPASTVFELEAAPYPDAAATPWSSPVTPHTALPPPHSPRPQQLIHGGRRPSFPASGATASSRSTSVSSFHSAKSTLSPYVSPDRPRTDSISSTDSSGSSSSGHTIRASSRMPPPSRATRRPTSPLSDPNLSYDAGSLESSSEDAKGKGRSAAPPPYHPGPFTPPSYTLPYDPNAPHVDTGPRLFFTSAATGQGVQDVFDYVVKRVCTRWEHENSPDLFADGEEDEDEDGEGYDLFHDEPQSYDYHQQQQTQGGRGAAADQGRYFGIGIGRRTPSSHADGDGDGNGNGNGAAGGGRRGPRSSMQYFREGSCGTGSWGPAYTNGPPQRARRAQPVAHKVLRRVSSGGIVSLFGGQSRASGDRGSTVHNPSARGRGRRRKGHTQNRDSIILSHDDVYNARSRGEGGCC